MSRGYEYSQWSTRVQAADIREGMTIVHDRELWTVDFVGYARDGNDRFRFLRISNPNHRKPLIGETSHVIVLNEHHPVCSRCGGLWPCLEHDRSKEGDRIMWDLANACSHCGDPVNGGWKTAEFTTPEGIRRRYHFAKKYVRCRLAAAAEAQRHGLTLNPATGRPDPKGVS